MVFCWARIFTKPNIVEAIDCQTKAFNILDVLVLRLRSIFEDYGRVLGRIESLYSTQTQNLII